jgi:hypothetical protein
MGLCNYKNPADQGGGGAKVSFPRADPHSDLGVEYLA